jgi:hypothetical protein
MQCNAGAGGGGANQWFNAVPNPEFSERFPGLLTRGKISFPSMEKSTSSERGKLFQSGERKITSMGNVQNFPLSAVGSSRIRNERVQGNPGVLLPFFTVWDQANRRQKLGLV